MAGADGANIGRLELDDMQSGQVLLLSQSGNPYLVTGHTETGIAGRIGLMSEFNPN